MSNLEELTGRTGPADERTMDELRALAETAGAEAVAMTLQRRPAPDARTFIGEGKAGERGQSAACRQAARKSEQVRQVSCRRRRQSNLEELTGHCRLHERAPALILDIFAHRGERPSVRYKRPGTRKSAFRHQEILRVRYRRLYGQGRIIRLGVSGNARGTGGPGAAARWR